MVGGFNCYHFKFPTYHIIILAWGRLFSWHIKNCIRFWNFLVGKIFCKKTSSHNPTFSFVLRIKPSTLFFLLWKRNAGRLDKTVWLETFERIMSIFAVNNFITLRQIDDQLCVGRYVCADFVPHINDVINKL